MDKVQNLKSSNTAPLSKTFRDEFYQTTWRYNPEDSHQNILKLMVAITSQI
jgi:hypothetical protein